MKNLLPVEYRPPKLDRLIVAGFSLALAGFLTVGGIHGVGYLLGKDLPETIATLEADTSVLDGKLATLTKEKEAHENISFLDDEIDNENIFGVQNLDYANFIRVVDTVLPQGMLITKIESPTKDNLVLHIQAKTYQTIEFFYTDLKDTQMFEAIDIESVEVNPITLAEKEENLDLNIKESISAVIVLSNPTNGEASLGGTQEYKQVEAQPKAPSPSASTDEE